MFESNFPVDKGSFSYAALWNTFKPIGAGCSIAGKSGAVRGHGEQILPIGIDGHWTQQGACRTKI